MKPHLAAPGNPAAPGGARGDQGSDLFIGLDLGTSGMKGIALNPAGEVVARATAAYPTSRPAAHCAEQEPGDWLAGTENVARQLAAGAPPERWVAIGLSAMLPTLVTAGADGSAIGPAITWQDSRAEAQASLLRDTFGASPSISAADRGGVGPPAPPGGDRLYRLTGQWVDGRYLLPMFARIVSDDPDRAGATRLLLSAKDYLWWWLTGEVATDPSTATGFGCYALQAGRWDADVLAAAAEASALGARGLPVLPPVADSTATSPLRAEIAARLGCGRIPVCIGAADSVLGALGLGARSAGQVAYIAGTSTVILGVADELKLDLRHRYLVTPLAGSGQWGLEMDQLATGSALRWLADLLGDGLDEAGVLSLAAQVNPGDAPIVLPYLSPGEQGALWDPTLTGAITGLTFGHDRRHLARGLANGIILESRRCLEVLLQAGPVTAGAEARSQPGHSHRAEILVAGGSARSASFRADLADATNRCVIIPAGHDTDFSARGAAMLAARAVGHFIAEADSRAVRAPEGEDERPPRATSSTGDPPRLHESGIICPDPSRAGVWDELWSAYERARLATQANGQ